MKRQAWIVMMVVAAGCGDNRVRQALVDPPADAPPTVDITPPVDAAPDAPTSVDAAPPVDAPPVDTFALCGKELTSLDDWEDCYRDRLCDVYVGCSIASPFSNLSDCINRLDAYTGGMISAQRRERARAIETFRARRDDAEFAQCLADTSRALCDTVLLDVACAKRFTGTIEDGAECYTDIECKSPGATCESSCTDACCPGTCRRKSKLGEACKAIDSCEPGLACNHTCKLGDIGASCVESADCDPDAWCHAGRCDHDLAEGDACTSLYQCGGETMCVGLSIRGSAAKCRRTSHVGDHCDVDCFGNLYCDGAGTCRDLPDLGDSCSPLTPCRGVDTICMSGRCELRAGVDDPCSANQLCRAGLFCTSELGATAATCAAPGGLHATCAAPSHCESYRCSGDPIKHGSCLDWPESCPLPAP
ncbi:MAG: hypothetical protein ABIY55_33070 [Kofleriaceae bacterium]